MYMWYTKFPLHPLQKYVTTSQWIRRSGDRRDFLDAKNSQMLLSWRLNFFKILPWWYISDVAALLWFALSFLGIRGCPVYMCTHRTHKHIHTHTHTYINIEHHTTWDHTHTWSTRCNTLQHAATRCNTLQHAATHCNTLQHAATRCNTGVWEYDLTWCSAL